MKQMYLNVVLLSLCLKTKKQRNKYCAITLCQSRDVKVFVIVIHYALSIRNSYTLLKRNQSYETD